MREINAINTKKHFVVTTGTNLFPTEYKNREQNRSNSNSVVLDHNSRIVSLNFNAVADIRVTLMVYSVLEQLIPCFD